MPTEHSRRSFVRGGLAFVLAAWASACATPQVGAPSPVPSTGVPLPTVDVPPGPYPSPQAPPVSVYPPPVAPIPPAATPNPYPVSSNAQFSGERALAHAAAQVQWIPRDTGSEGWAKCGDYIADQFAQLGWEVENQRFEYQGVTCRNIIAKKGSGPGVILGAHYDARRRADRDADPAKQQDPVPAANDGASGVAVLLELARTLDPEALGRTIWLAAFDAEDNGDLDNWQWIVGSTYMANALTMAPEAVVVIDMVGDAAQQLYYEQTSDERIREGVWTVGNDLGYSSFIAESKYAVIDDHTPFLQKGYRAIDIIDFDYPFWHTTEDTLDKISAASLEAVGKTLEEWFLRGGPGIKS